MLTFENLWKRTVNWGFNTGILEPGNFNVDKQALKMGAEGGEVQDEIAKGNFTAAEQELGDLIVTTVMLSAGTGINWLRGFEHAVQKIEARRGRLIDGVFVKEEDLPASENHDWVSEENDSHVDE
jgi:NTP pyrophosphatase (non-canonical NTP hydrolase)